MATTETITDFQLQALIRVQAGKHIEAAVLAEREACAKLAEDYELEDVGEEIAAAIRARK